MKDRHSNLCCGRNKEASIPAAEVQNEKKKNKLLTFRNEIAASMNMIFFFTQTAALQWIWMAAASVVLCRFLRSPETGKTVPSLSNAALYTPHASRVME